MTTAPAAADARVLAGMGSALGARGASAVIHVRRAADWMVRRKEAKASRRDWMLLAT